MSELPPRVKVICEGPTDFIVIESALNSILAGREIELVLIQPESSRVGGDAGPYGGGWKGVRNWCQARVKEAGSLRASSAMLQTELFVLHVDADVADDKEIGCRKPCPPPHHTTDALRQIVLGWVNETILPDTAVFCTPSKNTETWVLAALYPADKIVVSGQLECRDQPEACMVGKPKKERLVRKKAGQYDKDEEAYRQRGKYFTAAWPSICKICTEARRFSKDIGRVLGNSSS